MSCMVLVLFGWLILMAWVSSLCFLSGYDKAQEAIIRLSEKQTQSITYFNSIAVASRIKNWFGTIPTEQFTNKVKNTGTLVKDSLNEVLPYEHTEVEDFASDFLEGGKRIWVLTRLVTEIMFVKILILISAIPLFLLMTVAGLVDGLNQRAIRTASLGRESSYVFHQLNRYFKKGLLLLISLWLALPLSITPAFVFMPMSLLLGFMVSITSSRFKKYL